MTAADTIKDITLAVKRCSDCGARFGLEAQFCPFCGVALAQATWDPSRDPLSGTIVDNRYEVLGPIGEGGMGTVYKVRHVTLNRLFAMKVLRRDLATDAGLAQRFIQEARATAAIKHPAIVSISDFGVLQEGIPYFVMELLAGDNLATRMRARGPLAPREAINVARRIADGLAASHAANVIHRDLKPENVFIIGAGEIRIVDFGAAKIVGSSKLTRPGVVFGTPYYMSPEQASGQSIDARADVYSLGVLLYEMVTGHVPFEADTYMGVLTKHMFATPDKPSQKVAGIQLGALEDVVMRSLEKDPTARYASMAEVIRALDDAERTRASTAPGARADAAAPLKPKMSTAARIEVGVAKRVAEENRRQRRFVSIAIVFGVMTLLVGILVFGALTRQETSSSTPTTAAQPLPSPSPTPTPSAVPPPPPSASSGPAATTSAPVTASAPASPSPSTVAAAPIRPFRAVAPKAPPSPPATANTASQPSSTARRSEDFSDPWRK